MNSPSLTDTIQQVAEQIFENPRHITVDEILRTVSKLKGGTVMRVSIPPLVFLTQNPSTQSKWANRAREGQKIVWAIDESGNYKLMVCDGIIHTFSEKDRIWIPKELKDNG